VTLSATQIRKIAALARIAPRDDRIDALVADFGAILEELQRLAAIDTTTVEEAVGVGAAALPLRQDSGPPIPLTVAAAAFAPRYSDGFFLLANSEAPSGRGGS
jgi:aspartyl-tRNA(Asn)/glutamyl-tRNA(Gln) amidotransferase subunit C